MPFIQLPLLAGIIGLLAYSPETAKPLAELAEILLRKDRPASTLTCGERELIASYVSAKNNCTFCTNSHSAAAACYFDNNLALVQQVLENPAQAPISPKLKSLLAIAGKVQRSGKRVTEKDIVRAKKAGATDQEIHDTVLIAAAFCMYNRYVDGLGTLCSDNPTDYQQMGQSLATDGYIR